MTGQTESKASRFPLINAAFLGKDFPCRLAESGRHELALMKAPCRREFPPRKRILLLCGLLALSTPVLAQDQAGDGAGLKNAVILIIRHAEKPDKGDRLSKAGEQRAKAYVNYFKNFTVDSNPLKVDYLFSTADSKESHRARLTLEPFSQAVGLAIDHRFEDTEFQKLAGAIRAKPPGKQFLICWHHGEIPHLVRALGADPSELFRGKNWPDDVYDWVIQLRYDANGQVVDAKRIVEDIKLDGKRRK
jgi:hypothetical protein